MPDRSEGFSFAIAGARKYGRHNYDLTIRFLFHTQVREAIAKGYKFFESHSRRRQDASHFQKMELLPGTIGYSVGRR